MLNARTTLLLRAALLPLLCGLTAVSGQCAIPPYGQHMSVGDTVVLEASGFSSYNDLHIGICGSSSCSVFETDVESLRCSDRRVLFRIGYQRGLKLSSLMDGYYDEAHCGFPRPSAVLAIDLASSEEAHVRVNGSADVLAVLPLNATSNPGPKAMLQVFQRRPYYTVLGAGRRNGDVIAIGQKVRVRITAAPDNSMATFKIVIGNEAMASVYEFQGHDGESVGYSTYLAEEAASPLPYFREPTDPISWYSKPPGPTEKTYNTVFVAVVERRSSDEMVVWLESNPDVQASLPLDPDMDQLSIHTKDPVATPIEFLAPQAPRQANDLAVAVREMVRVRFTPADSKSWLRISLCGTKCSVYHIAGVGTATREGQWQNEWKMIQVVATGYEAFVSNGSTPSSGISSLFRRYAGPVGYPSGVEHHDFWVMIYSKYSWFLWHNNKPVEAESIPITADRNRLWVESNTGQVQVLGDYACGTEE